MVILPYLPNKWLLCQVQLCHRCYETCWQHDGNRHYDNKNHNPDPEVNWVFVTVVTVCYRDPTATVTSKIQTRWSVSMRIADSQLWKQHCYPTTADQLYLTHLRHDPFCQVQLCHRCYETCSQHDGNRHNSNNKYNPDPEVNWVFVTVVTVCYRDPTATVTSKTQTRCSIADSQLWKQYCYRTTTDHCISRISDTTHFVGCRGVIASRKHVVSMKVTDTTVTTSTTQTLK
jgi:hypothetical protein